MYFFPVPETQPIPVFPRPITEKKSASIKIKTEGGAYILHVLRSDIPLQPITVEELRQRRKNHLPTFVLKVDEKLFFASVPPEADFTSAVCFDGTSHQCAGNSGTAVCHRLIATSYENGGCPKVMNHARSIEKFPFITFGYEAFDTKGECLYVAKCKLCDN